MWYNFLRKNVQEHIEATSKEGLDIKGLCQLIIQAISRESGRSV